MTPDPAAEPCNAPPSALHQPPFTDATDESRFPTHDPRRTVWIGIAFEAGLALLALGLAWCLGKSPLSQIHFNTLRLLAYAAATIPLVGGMRILLGMDWRLVRELRHLIDESVLPMFTGARWWELALLCAAAGLGEELLFRGLLQPIFCGSLGLVPGIVLVNLLFGLVHPFSVLYVVLAGLIGIYLSGFLVATENLLAPIVVHGLYDFAAFFWMTRFSRPERQEID